jgi:hypothetical protein
MADTPKQTPLGINCIGSLLNNTGFTINPIVTKYLGTSKSNTDYTFGKLISETCLLPLTVAINDAYVRGLVNTSTYQNLITIGKQTIPALGNSMPDTYNVEDPSGNWTTKAVKYGQQLGIPSPLPGPANVGYPINSNVNHGQSATWYPYDSSNPNFGVSQWGYLRLHALQAWNEFNWNNDNPTGSVDYVDFLTSIMTAESFIRYNNEVILSTQNAKTFMDGIYSNMDDLITSDCSGVNLANESFGIDLENLGYVLDLSTIDTFGFPSNLLKILGDRNAIIQDLALSLILTGMSDTEIQDLISGKNETPTIEQEQKIYKAFQVITGENLQEILNILECKTPGINNLADLLNVKKLFPTSYRTLTVPKYNETLGLPTNSKTYFLIFENDNINDAITTEAMNEYVGYQTPIRTPNDNSNNTTDIVTKIKKGFGSHLFNILPREQAIAAGAFVFAMRQIKNIDKVNIKDFARVIKSLETTKDLSLIAGTSKPTDDSLIQNTQSIQALGSGPYGTYTFSDFFGSMSGLPYPWEKIYDAISILQNNILLEIYNQLFLAVTWEQATATVESVEGPPGVWTVTGITITNPGGGYGRENIMPTASINGVPVQVTIGIDPSNIGSNGTGEYGRVLNIQVPGGTFNSLPVITISPPPGNGFPSINTDIQNYINQANAEIQNISNAKPEVARLLNIYWNILGEQLKIEQRTRFVGLSPVDITKDLFTNLYPSTVNIFVDSLGELAQDTLPHMSAQTIEAIADLSNIGGQSIIGLMRQERNKTRLNSVGLDQDNNIPSKLSDMDMKTLLTNNTIPAGINNVINSPLIDRIKNNPMIFGDVLKGVKGFTIPSWHRNIVNENVIYPTPKGKYIPSDTRLIGEYQVAILSPNKGYVPGDITGIINGEVTPIVNNIVPAQFEPEIFDSVSISLPYELDSDLTITMDMRYSASTMLPSVYNTKDALNKITDSNCDCWVL